MPTCKTVRRLYCIEAGATDRISSAASSALGIVRDIRHHSPLPDDHQFLFDVLEALFAASGHDLAEHVHGCAEQCAIINPASEGTDNPSLGHLVDLSASCDMHCKVHWASHFTTSACS